MSKKNVCLSLLFDSPYPLQKIRKSYRIIELRQPSTLKKFKSYLAPLTFSTSNLIIQELRNIYKLKELINLPVSIINPV